MLESSYGYLDDCIKLVYGLFQLSAC